MTTTPSAISTPKKKKRTPLPKPVKVTVSVLFACWCVDYLDRMLITIALPHIGAEFDLSNTQKGLLVSSFFLTYTLFQIPGGMLADRFGGKKVAAFSMLTWSLFTALTALTRGFGALLAVRALFGIAQAPFTGAAAKIVSERTSKEQNMTAQGIVSSSNGVGAILSAVIIPPTIVLLGWRNTFYAAAALGAVCLFLIIKAIPPKAVREQRAASDEPADSRRNEKQILALLLCPSMLIFAAMSFGERLIAWGVQSWMPSYLVDVHNVSTSGSMLMLGIPALMVTIGTIIGGRLTDHLRGGTAKIVTPAMVVAAIALIVMATSSSLTAFIIWQCVAMFTVGLCMIPVISAPLKALTPDLAGGAYSIINFGGQLAGIIVPVAMGVLVDAFGYTAAFIFLASGAVLSVVMGVLAPQTPEAFAAKVSRNPNLAQAIA